MDVIAIWWRAIGWTFGVLSFLLAIIPFLDVLDHGYPYSEAALLHGFSFITGGITSFGLTYTDGEQNTVDGLFLNFLLFLSGVGLFCLSFSVEWLSDISLFCGAVCYMFLYAWESLNK